MSKPKQILNHHITNVLVLKCPFIAFPIRILLFLFETQKQGPYFHINMYIYSTGAEKIHSSKRD